MATDSYREAFNLFDKDGDGYITTKELGTVMRALGKCPTEAEVKQIITEVDPDSKGVINLPEFLNIMSRDIREFDNEKDLRAAWKVFDKENKGVISTAELRHVLSSIGEKLSAEEMDDMTKAADPEGKGSIGCEEFVKVCEPHCAASMVIGRLQRGFVPDCES